MPFPHQKAMAPIVCGVRKSNGSLPETDISPLDKALQLHKSGQLQAAEAAYRQILQDNPADRDALNNLGILLRMQGRLNEALIVLQQLTSLNPDFPEAQNLSDLDKWQKVEAEYPDAFSTPESYGTYRLWCQKK